MHYFEPIEMKVRRNQDVMHYWYSEAKLYQVAADQVVSHVDMHCVGARTGR